MMMKLRIFLICQIILEEYKLMLSYVLLPDSKIKDGYINLHGHIHNKKISDDYPKNYSENKHINLVLMLLTIKHGWN